MATPTRNTSSSSLDSSPVARTNEVAASSQPARPSWWKEELASGWNNVKEALRRDWEQTKHDLHLGGHELNQKLTDTVEQAVQEAPVRPIDRPNPPRVIGDASDWEVVEEPMKWGFYAHSYYGKQYPSWSDELEGKLRQDWDTTSRVPTRPWSEVNRHVRTGYEHRDPTRRS